MKIIITESQFEDIKKIKSEKLMKVFFNEFPGITAGQKFQNILDAFEKMKEKKGFTGIEINDNLYLDYLYFKTLGPLKKVTGDLNLYGTKGLKSLGELEEVGGKLTIVGTKITDLGELRKVGEDIRLNELNIKSLGKLESVGKNIELFGCKELVSLGNLKSVGGYMFLQGTPISETMSEEEIRSMVTVKGTIFLED
jgi:hypothetical protein